MRVKYPRTYHFDFSPGVSSDDKIIQSLENFIGKQVIVTEKMDGENSSLYSDFYHARSLDSAHHESRSWLKHKQSEIGYLIPEGWRICGENMYARHSIEYSGLKSYFYVFNIWDENNMCLSWDQTEEWCKLLGLELVPVLYCGVFDYNKIKKIFEDLDQQKQEGIVVRTYGAFMYNDFPSSVAKAVRANHIQTDEHWMSQKLVKNDLG
jgi:hypothetical protein